MKKFFKKIATVVNNTVLCIRFPFLYPRNRFNGLHYNNRWISEYSRRNTPKTNFSLVVTLKQEKDKPKKYEFKYQTHIFHDLKYIVDYKDTTFILSFNKKTNILKISSSNEVLYEHDISDMVTKPSDIKYVAFDNIFEKSDYHKRENLNVTIVTNDDSECELKNKFYFIEFKIKKWLRFKISFLEWINKYVLQLFHCLPTSTELDAMPRGWRKAFGIDICKDVRRDLIRCGWKYLFTYRIMQIKEKFGGLRWYDSFIPKDSNIFGIIDKYEAISYKTCIECGKPATWVSTGWISPYCDDCIGDTIYAKRIGDEDENNLI